MDGLAYYRAHTPEPWTILGLRLRPFSLGHIHLLHRFESAFVDPDGQPGIGDLILACFICSRRYQDTLDALEDERLERFLSSWRQRLARPTLWHRLRLRRPVKIDWPTKLESFVRYMRDGSTYPTFSVADQPSQPCLVPLPLIVRMTLMSKAGLTDERLMDRPWGLCLWEYITVKSFDGSVRLVDSDALREAYDAAKRMAEGLKANGDSRPEMQN